ncbi:hypothetical protein GCM10010528_10810 [Gordonia defluvii]|jgi:hypothetical protein|uniref:ESX-1 scaffolding and assembly protein SaeA n=1 Tax=Gordonia defluvii TaxID=283718 RepID=A0ABP6L6A7_9ACTN|nr:hypothetical protein [Gordonia sp. UBA5067]
MTTSQDLVAALVQWATGAAADGGAVPPDRELEAIARRPDSWRTDIAASPAAQYWGATIDHVLGQVRLGVLPMIAVAHVPAGLAPTGPPPQRPEAPGGPGRHAESTGSARPGAATDPVEELTAALIAWRGSKIAEGAPGAETIKDLTLRNLAKRAPVSAEQLRKKLPGAGALVDELATVFGRFGGDDAPVLPPVDPQPVRAAVAPEVPPVARSIVVDPDLLALTHADFPEFAFDKPGRDPGAISIATTPDGVRLSWDACSDGARVIYRVVSGDEPIPPYKPEAGESLAVTTGTSAEDTRFLTSAVRHYQVWVQAGVDEASARAAQPVKWAVGEDISPVEDMRLTEDEGRVVGEWSVFAGTQAVRVFRIPLDEGGPITTDPRYQIALTEPNLTGFVDADAPRGRRYLYRAQAEVPVGNQLRLSRPAQQEILVSVKLTSIADLAVAISANNSQFDLSWTTPEGGQDVRIFRFQQPPPAGLEREDLAVDALSPQGFNDATRVRHPVKAGTDPSRSQMSGVPWPSGWDRAYLTPVTMASGKARIGMTRVLARPLSAVVEPRIVERFHCEMITFGWPRGAAAVRAYIGQPGVPSEQLCHGRPFGEVSAEQYQRDGALILARPLTLKGCQVALVAVSYSAGREITGEPVGITYPGLARIAYNLEPQPAAPGRHVVRLVLHSESSVIDLPPLVLVHRPDRLPLDAADGRAWRFYSDSGQQVPHCQIGGELLAGLRSTEWVADLTGVTGYVRLFIHDGTRRNGRPIAILDPPMANLRLLPPGPPQGER